MVMLEVNLKKNFEIFKKWKNYNIFSENPDAGILIRALVLDEFQNRINGIKWNRVNGANIVRPGHITVHH